MISSRSAHTDGYSTKLPDRVVVIVLKALYDDTAPYTMNRRGL
jgi:hypothetical protein